MNSPTNDWHIDKKIIVGLIFGVGSNIAISGLNLYVTTVKLESRVSVVEKNILSRADIVERVIRLEATASEQGRLLSQVGVVLDRFERTLDRVEREQARRTVIVENSAEHLRDHNGSHKRKE